MNKATMMKYIADALIFAGGFIAGTVVCKSVMTKKYEERIDREIAEMKKTEKGVHVEATVSKEVYDFVNKMESVDENQKKGRI